MVSTIRAEHNGGRTEAVLASFQFPAARPPTAPRSRSLAGRPAFADILVEAKVGRPAATTGIPRPRLVERLDARAPAPLVALVAPAGYGKTVLLSQWALGLKRPVAWVAADENDNDPANFATYLELAMARAGVDRDEPFVLVVDNAEKVTNPASVELVVALAESAGPGTKIAIATRNLGRWPIALLCASGKATCLGRRDLGLTDDEAADLLVRAGFRGERGAAHQLNRLADGWPAGLYLYAVEAARTGTDDLLEIAPARGSLLAEYVRREVVSGLTPKELQFLVRTSMLERLYPALCDAVLGVDDSEETLRAIEERHGLLTRAGDDHAYRLQAMIRGVLVDELERSGGDAVRLAYVRAAHWYESQGLVVDAAAQAAAGLDREAVDRLLPTAMRRALADGRSNEAAGWIRQLEAAGDLLPRTEIAAPVAIVYATLGDSAASERWAEGAWVAAQLVGRRSALGDASLARSLICRWGWPRMRADARLALRMLPAGDERVPIAHMLLGVADVLAGDLERADAGLARAAAAAATFRNDAWAAAIALAFQASLAWARHDRATAESLLREARTLIIRMSLDGEPVGVLVRAVAARLAGSRGLHAQARGDLEIVQANLSVATAAIPWLAVRARLDIAATQLALSDVDGAAEMLTELRQLIRARPRLGTLTTEVDRLDEQIRASRESCRRGVSLTAAELRLLPFLATHLGMSQIAARLFVSTNTVKTEAKSIYRKLAVSCRSDAVERAAEVGLLQPTDDLLPQSARAQVSSVEPVTAA